MRDDPTNRATWAYQAMLPHRVWDYPLPAVMPVKPPPSPGIWPPAMDPQVRAFDDRTAGLPRTNFIYVHIPFCPFHCSFCGFYTKVSKGGDDAYIDLVEREIELYRDWVPAARRYEYDFVYFGGGTPSQMDAHHLARVLDALRSAFKIAADSEVTLEGVADQMVRDGFLSGCRDAGFTRVAFGVQSLDPRVRRAIGRGKEDVDAFPAVVGRARELGMAANVELMMGCPEQTIESLGQDLREVVSWDPASIDVTAYVPIPGTNLYDRLLQQRFDERDHALPYGARLLAMRQLVTSTLREAGYHPARAESFSRDDHRFEVACGGGVGNSLHAQLAFGPSAHGHLAGTAFANVADLNQYQANLEAGLLPIDRAVPLTLRSAKRRALLDALGGLFLPDELLEPRHARMIEGWLAKGLVERVDAVRGYALTERGVHWENQLQMEVMGTREALKGFRMIGNFRDQLSLVKSGNGMGAELLEQAGNGSSVRRFGYTAGLWLLSHAPFVDQRSLGLLGAVDKERKERPEVELGRKAT